MPDATKRPHEKQDRLAAARLAKLPAPPSAASCAHLIAEVFDQGQLGSCVANAGMQAIRASHVRQFMADGLSAEKARRASQPGSRLFGYYLPRAYTHETQYDNGTQIRLFFTAVNKYGYCPESVYPYSDALGPKAQFARMPTQAAFRAAFDQRSPTLYERIRETGYDRVTAVQRAIANGQPVVFGTDVSEHFCGDMGANNGKPIDPPKNLTIAGGHAMLLAGYDALGADVVNSWSKIYGNAGWCRFSWDYVAWSKTSDLWVVSQAPRYAQ